MCPSAVHFTQGGHLPCICLTFMSLSLCLAQQLVCPMVLSKCLLKPHSIKAQVVSGPNIAAVALGELILSPERVWTDRRAYHPNKDTLE